MATSSPQFPISRRTLLASAGAVSLSAALAACGGDGKGGGTSAAAAVSQADIDKAMSTADRADVLDLGSGHRARGGAVREEVPGHQGQGGQRRSGRPGVHQAAHGVEGRHRRSRRGADRVPVHPDLHHHRQPAGPAPVRRGGAEGQVRGLDVGAGQRAQRRGLGDPAGHRSDGHAVPQGHLRQVRHPGPDDLGRVRRRGPQAPRRQPERLPDQHRAESARRVARAAVAGGRQALREVRQEHHRHPASTTRRPRSSPRTGAGWPRRASSATEPDFTDPWFAGAQQRQVRHLAHRGLGTGLPLRLARSPPRASGAPPRCRSGTRRKPQSGNWGGSTTRGHQGDQEPDRGGGVRPVPQHRPGQRPRCSPPSSSSSRRRRRCSPTPPSSARPRPSTAARRSTRCSPRSAAPSPPTFQWPPFLDQVETDWNETVGKALADKTDAVAALDQWQTRITTYAKGQGFTVQ